MAESKSNGWKPVGVQLAGTFVIVIGGILTWGQTIKDDVSTLKAQNVETHRRLEANDAQHLQLRQEWVVEIRALRQEMQQK